VPFRHQVFKIINLPVITSFLSAQFRLERAEPIKEALAPLKISVFRGIVAPLLVELSAEQRMDSTLLLLVSGGAMGHFASWILLALDSGGSPGLGL